MRSASVGDGRPAAAALGHAKIYRLYLDVESAALEDALDLERQLAQNLRPASGLLLPTSPASASAQASNGLRYGDSMPPTAPHEDPWEFPKYFATYNDRSTDSAWAQFELSAADLARDPLLQPSPG